MVLFAQNSPGFYNLLPLELLMDLGGRDNIENGEHSVAKIGEEFNLDLTRDELIVLWRGGVRFVST